MRNQLYIGHTSRKIRQALDWLIISIFFGASAVIALQPGGAGAYTLTSASHHANYQKVSQPASTPSSNLPTIIPTPSQGPVKTLVTLQGNGWPVGSQVLISYDSDSSCSGPNLTELSTDPKPTVNSSGSFSASFSWPAVSKTGFWYICAATSDNAAAGAAEFNVLSLSPPALTILTKGPFLPGQTMLVQGQNWFPGGYPISFALQPAHTTGSFALEETVVSLFNGTFGPISITIPTYLSAGNYILVATMEQQALEAQSSAITIAATPTPTPTATPSPSPTPIILITPTPTLRPPQSSSTPRRLSGTLLALVVISGGMALCFGLIGVVLLIYLLRSRSIAQAPLALEPFDEISD